MVPIFMWSAITKSDKNLLADMTGGLSMEDFETIAKANPRTYLYNSIHGGTHYLICGSGTIYHSF